MLGFWFVASSKLSSSSSASFLVKVFFAEELFDGQPLCALQLGLLRVSRVYKITNSKRFGTYSDTIPWFENSVASFALNSIQILN
jgi:hypothetical protein